LLSLPSETEQRDFAQKIIDEKLTARQVEKEMQLRKKATEELSSSMNVDKHTDKAIFDIDNDETNIKSAILLEMEENLRRFFGTKVSIKVGKNEGKVEFVFYNDDDLERLLQLLLNQ
jgi:ParB family chromosome partitioning protein